MDVRKVCGLELLLDPGGDRGREEESEVQSRMEGEDVQREMEDGSDVSPEKEGGQRGGDRSEWARP